MRPGALCIAAVLIVFSKVSFSQQIPGFTTQVVSSQWNQAVGLTFENTGNVMFVWERGGKVWTVENNQKNIALDISEEVGAYGDLGLLGFALDPAFASNGYIYLLYTVDRHHLVYYGTSSYSPTANYNYAATIQRLTRYTATKSASGYIVDQASRKILIGTTRTNGIPSVAPVHGPGSLLFGTDGTLLIASGDAAGASGVDTGNATGTYYSLALSNGIITPAENVGAFRSQLLESYCGKILRIDPATGAGVSSNPFFDPANPNSPRSKVWTLGVRNGFRMSLKPQTGSRSPADGNPGTIILGDVGHVTWEEVNVIDKPGMNLGWPLFEGFTSHSGYATRNVQNLNAPNPAYGGTCTRRYFYFYELIKQATASGTATFINTCNSQPIPSTIKTFIHSRPLIDWGHATTAPSRCGTFLSNGTASTMNIGAAGSPVSGPQFNGKCAVGGVFYTHNDFPPEYQNTYIFADYTRKWIRSMKIDGSNMATSVSNTIDTGAVVAIALHPVNGGLYFIDFTSTIKKITYGGENKQPTAIASSDKRYGQGPLTVQFDGSKSTDPEGEPLTYLWNFGDGSTSAETNPSKTFTPETNLSTKYLVTLTVTDNVGNTARDSVTIFVNNEPPVISITSPLATDRYAMNGQTTLKLRASATDKEDAADSLLYEWIVTLFHDDHNHPEAPIVGKEASAITSPLGCGAELYFYRVQLRVTDAGGLTSTKYVDVYPYCDYIASFTLVNADTDKDIQELTNGSTIDLGKLGVRMINIRANPSPANVYGVQFYMSGTRSKNISERSAPFALFSDVKGDYFGWDAPSGSYTLRASPYNSKAIRGVELMVGFRIVRTITASASVLDASETAGQVAKPGKILVFPNPTRDYFIVDLPPSNKPVQLVVTDVYGRQVLQLANVTAGRQVSFGNQLSAGVYLVKIYLGDRSETFRLVKSK